MEDPCAPSLLRELAGDARREGEAWVVVHDNSDRAVQGALLAPCATAEHVTVWRYVMTREARLEVTVDSADPMETVAWVLDRCEPVLAEPMACAPSAPVPGSGLRATTRTTEILRAGTTVYVAAGGARRPPREGEGPRVTRGRFTLRVEERTPTADGAPCALTASVAECARDASCQEREVLAGDFICVRDGGRRGRCRAAGTLCDEGLRCIEGLCRGGAPGGTCVFVDRFACEEGAHCVASGGGDYRCIADGAELGRCRQEGRACDEGLRCNAGVSLSNARCWRAREDGEACDDVEELCADGSSCVEDATTPGAPPFRCRRMGTVLGDCRTEEPYCDDGLACERVPAVFGARCFPARQVGEECAGAGLRGACVSPARCVVEGARGVCHAPPYDAPVRVVGGAVDACTDGGMVVQLGEPVRLPVPVRLFNISYEQVWPSARGYAVFGPQPTRTAFTARLPVLGEGPMIAPLLADLLAPSTARLCARWEAVARRLVLSWTGFAFEGREGSRVDVSATIDASGEVEFRYDTVTVGRDLRFPDAPVQVAVGLQDSGGFFHLSTPLPAAGSGLRFRHR